MKSEKREKIIDSISLIDEDIINDALTYRTKADKKSNVVPFNASEQKSRKIKWGALIAAAAAVAIVGTTVTAVVAEQAEYNAAVAYFEEKGQSTEGLSRSEIKEAYREKTFDDDGHVSEILPEPTFEAEKLIGATCQENGFVWYFDTENDSGAVYGLTLPSEGKSEPLTRLLLSARMMCEVDLTGIDRTDPEIRFVNKRWLVLSCGKKVRFVVGINEPYTLYNIEDFCSTFNCEYYDGHGFYRFDADCDTTPDDNGVYTIPRVDYNGWYDQSQKDGTFIAIPNKHNVYKSNLAYMTFSSGESIENSDQAAIILYRTGSKTYTTIATLDLTSNPSNNMLYPVELENGGIAYRVNDAFYIFRNGRSDLIAQSTDELELLDEIHSGQSHIFYFMRNRTTGALTLHSYSGTIRESREIYNFGVRDVSEFDFKAVWERLVVTDSEMYEALIFTGFDAPEKIACDKIFVHGSTTTAVVHDMDGWHAIEILPENEAKRITSEQAGEVTTSNLKIINRVLSDKEAAKLARLESSFTGEEIYFTDYEESGEGTTTGTVFVYKYSFAADEFTLVCSFDVDVTLAHDIRDLDYLYIYPVSVGGNLYANFGIYDDYELCHLDMTLWEFMSEDAYEEKWDSAITRQNGDLQVVSTEERLYLNGDVFEVWNRERKVGDYGKFYSADCDLETKTGVFYFAENGKTTYCLYDYETGELRYLFSDKKGPYVYVFGRYVVYLGEYDQQRGQQLCIYNIKKNKTVTAYMPDLSCGVGEMLEMLVTDGHYSVGWWYIAPMDRFNGKLYYLNDYGDFIEIDPSTGKSKTLYKGSWEPPEETECYVVEPLRVLNDKLYFVSNGLHVFDGEKVKAVKGNYDDFFVCEDKESLLCFDLSANRWVRMK